MWVKCQKAVLEIYDSILWKTNVLTLETNIGVAREPVVLIEL